MAARWVGASRPRNRKNAARRGLRHTIKDFVHAVGALGVLVMAAALNFAMYPDALASVIGDELITLSSVPAEPLLGEAASAPVVNEDEVRLLSATVWGEARSEGEAGMRAVAHVMVNRIGERFGEDLATVILAPKQFSVWNRGDPNRRLVLGLVRDPDRYVTDAAQWEAAQRIAREVLSGQSVDPTGGALFYHTRAVRPRWARYGVGRQTIGAHIFYADVPDSGERRTPRVTNVAHIFGRPMLIGPSAGAVGAADPNAAATPTLNGVAITQAQHAGASH